MRRVSLSFVTLFALGVTVLAVGPAHGAESGPAVVIFEPHPVALLSAGANGLRDAVEDGLKTAGARVVGREQAAPTCGTPSCLRTLAKSAGADYVVRIEAAMPSDREFHVDLSVWSAKREREIAQAQGDCGLCIDQQIQETTRNLARRVYANAVTREGEGERPTGPPVAVPGHPVFERPWWPDRTWPLGLVAVGTGSVVWGSVLLAINGHGDCGADRCVQSYDSRTEGIGFLAAGVAVAALGLYFEHRALQPVTVAVGPGSITLGGRF